MKIHPLSCVINRHMTFTLLTGAILAASLVPLYSAHAENTLSCATAVSDANQKLQQRNEKTIKNEKDLVKLLEILNRDDVLPNNYVTSRKAKELGWSGNDNESLWDTWALNKKSIGGDKIENRSLPENHPWYSADIESVRGYRSSKRLVYSPQTQTRYLTTDYYQSWVKIPACE